MTAAELIALAEGKVTLVWPDDGPDYELCERKGQVGYWCTNGSVDEYGKGDERFESLPPAVALALTVTAIEAGLPLDWRVVRDAGGGYSVQCYDFSGGWQYLHVRTSHPTRADALAALLMEMPKGTTV